MDAHAHGVISDRELELAEFEQHLTESSWPAPPGCSHSDTPLGLAVRARCNPLLGLSGGATLDRYVTRRRELGVAEVARPMLSAAKLETVLLDTGFGGTWSCRYIFESSNIQSREIVRLENLAEEIIDSRSAESFPDDFHDALTALGEHVVGFKSVLAYRSGFDIPADPPERSDVVGALRRWKSTRAHHLSRLSDPVIIRHLLWAALRLPAADERPRRPVQLHVGYGDADIDLSRTDPLLLTPFVRQTVERDTAPLILLHGYPFHRHTSYLASVYPQVYCDIGLSVGHLGASAVAVMAESLEVTPFHKLQFSTDACGLPEFFTVGSELFRRGLAAVFQGWIDRDDLQPADAARFSRMILHDNAVRIYGLD